MADRRPLMPLDEVLERLVAGARAHAITATETVSTFDALGRVLAVPVSSALDVPPADNTSMDGYALHAADVASPGAVLAVAQRIPAGSVGQPLARGSAARIFTGAQIPAGADAVVMQEDCEALAGEGLGAVRVNAVPRAGQWIRRRGEDIRCDAEVLAQGSRLSAAALGLAASVGAATLTVVHRPRVALMSTGDELVMPGQPLPPGAIYNSNRYLLRGLLQAAGCEITDFGIVPDRREATIAALREAAIGHDLILTSGGVSTGEEDHIRPAVQAQGWIEDWQVAIKPGKPLAFGGVRCDDGSVALFMGLPGNPVSCFVNFLVTVSPVLRAMQGAAALQPRGLRARADFDWPRADRRREFLRARFNDAGGLELYANQSSGVLSSAVWGDGLIDNPAGQTIARGDMVRFLPFPELLG